MIIDYGSIEWKFSCELYCRFSAANSNWIHSRVELGTVGAVERKIQLRATTSMIFRDLEFRHIIS